MRITSIKLASIAVLAIAILAMAPMASAGSTSLSITANNIGATGTLGTVSIVDSGTNQVTVTITMNPTGCGGSGCDFKLNGGDIVFGLSSGSITSVSLGTGVSAHLKNNNPGPFKLTGSVFNIQNITGAGSTATNTFTFTITGTGLSAASFASVELHVCSAANLTQCTNNTGFGLGTPSSTPPTVPEPGTLGLLGTGLVGIAGLLRRRLS